jgi:kinesin family protein 4/21/27
VSTNGQNFTYDNVYGGMGKPDDLLYPECIQPLVAGIFKGYNATVFAYGQTGSGKTFTMGSQFSPGVPCTGVIPQVVEEIFSRMSKIMDTEFTVRVSFIEIHQASSLVQYWVASLWTCISRYGERMYTSQGHG